MAISEVSVTLINPEQTARCTPVPRGPRLAYQPPIVLFEQILEVRAGSPLSMDPLLDPLHPDFQSGR